MRGAQKVSRWGDDELEALIEGLEERWRDGQMLLRAFPREATIRGQCPLCGLERLENVEELVIRFQAGDSTLSDLGEALRCPRASCGERMVYDVE